ncbi:tyrosine-type recombinase/integrase [Cupriavidus sp. P-10]|uniref:phage integrase family protein n=1 Tax=Cupriavidus sp. P-10 TaxID=2027911 RepID=UPI000ECF556A|nr:tyrosine-type recombinase/integrase [Cupriavidus sp. P-10]BDB27798.1 tyrosine-type recombinase/integrase [Cupriavidus sp. P-10]
MASNPAIPHRPASAGTPPGKNPTTDGRRRRGAGQPVAATHHLGAHHFALYRGNLEAVDLAVLGDCYLDTGRDRRQVRLTLAMIEAELLRGVRRLQAAAAESDPTADADCPSKKLPTAEAWQRLFRKTGAGVPARVRARQLAALEALRPLLTRTPARTDPVAGWFSQPVATRLEAAGLATLAVLHGCVLARGVRWYRRVPRIGAMTAKRIVAWLQTESAALGALAPAALVPRRGLAAATRAALRPPAVMIAPLEALALPAERDGHIGHNRPGPGATPRTTAQTDLAAIQAWLATCGPEDGQTWRTYRCHSERFLLWAVFARGKALSDLTVEDCTAYLAFLADPQPADRWVGPRGVPRYSYGWRPLAGPLSPHSVRQSYTVLRGMFGWLVEAQYLRYNPFALVSKPRSARTRIQVARSFSKTQWAFLQRCAADLPADDPRSMRLQFLLRFAYSTGLRISELARATVGDLRHHDLQDDPRGSWELVFTGKGTVEREVHVSHTVIAALRRYLAQRGLSEDFGRLHPATPLIGRVKADGQAGALSVQQIHAILKRFFTEAAAALQEDDPASAARLAKASAHFLRHSFGMHAVAVGVGLDVVQSQLGHASLSTTSVYVRTEAERRAQELERPGIF